MPEVETGPPTQHWAPLFDTGVLEAQPISATEPVEPQSEPLPAFVPPAQVPGTSQHLKRWTFVVITTAFWTVAAAAGLALYEWWFQSTDKTWPVFVVLIYLTVTTVAALLAAMVQNKPVVSAAAMALMSAPLASTAAAAALYGAYVFEWIDR